MTAQRMLGLSSLMTSPASPLDRKTQIRPDVDSYLEQAAAALVPLRITSPQLDEIKLICLYCALFEASGHTRAAAAALARTAADVRLLCLRNGRRRFSNWLHRSKRCRQRCYSSERHCHIWLLSRQIVANTPSIFAWPLCATRKVVSYVPQLLCTCRAEADAEDRSLYLNIASNAQRPSSTAMHPAGVRYEINFNMLLGFTSTAAVVPRKRWLTSSACSTPTLLLLRAKSDPIMPLSCPISRKRTRCARPLSVSRLSLTVAQQLGDAANEIMLQRGLTLPAHFFAASDVLLQSPMEPCDREEARFATVAATTMSYPCVGGAPDLLLDLFAVTLRHK